MMQRSSACLIALVVVAAAGLVLALTAGSAQAQNDADHPNIIILFADDLGYGDLSSYGHPTIETPNLDEMAREGIRLTSFYAQTWCVPSRAALLTGRYPVRYGFQANGGVGSTGGLPPSEVTLAEVLQKEGYRTKMVGKWHLGYAREELLPTAQGFGSWYGLPYSNDMQPPWVDTDVPLRMYRNTEPIERPVDQDKLTISYTEEAVEFIRASTGEPFFLYLAYNMPHLPLHTTERFRGTSRAGLYGDVIRAIDWSAGRILQALEEEGLAKNTIVIFTSDNGPWLDLPERMLQGGVEPWHAGSPGPLRGWKNTAWEGGIRVPGILRWPGHIETGQVSAEMAATLDLFPTLAIAAGAELPTGRPIDGHNLLPFLTGRAEESPREAFFYFDHERLVAVRVGPWKLWVKSPDSAGGRPAKPSVPALYHLGRDPSERYNVAEEHPEVVARLQKKVHRFAEEVGMQGAE